MWDEIQDMPGEIFDIDDIKFEDQVEELMNLIADCEELEARTMMSPPASEEFTNNFTVWIMNTFQEEEKYQELFSILLMSGEYREQDIDEQVNYIMDHPQYFPEYF